MHIRTLLLIAIASAALIPVSHARDRSGRGGRNGQGYMSIPGSAIASTRCYTQIASTPAQHDHLTAWTTETTSCALTATYLSTITISPTSTLTSTLTYTTSITHTVPAPSSFTPIQASLHNSTYNEFGSINYKSNSGLTHLYSKPEDFKNLIPIGLTYPQGVRCHVWEPETRCLTKTKTSVSTVIETAFVSLTTVTTTKVSKATVATVYEACATDNLARPDQGSPFSQVSGGFTGVDILIVDTAYDCCVAAITDPDQASVFAFDPVPFGGPGAYNCFIGVNGGTCPNPAENPAKATRVSASGLVFGNGFCGGINAAVPPSIPPQVNT